MDDFYIEQGRVVFTEAYHRRRGVCCGSGCRHCPFREPRDFSPAPAPATPATAAPRGRGGGEKDPPAV